MEKEFCFDGYRYRHFITESTQARNVSGHFHPTYEILYFQGENASLALENRRYRLSRGDLLLIPPSRYHDILLEGEGPHEQTEITFRESLVKRELLAPVFGGGCVYHTASLPEIAEHYRRLARYAELPSTPDRDRLAEILLSELLCLCAGMSPALPTAESKNPMLDAALAYIDSHLTAIRDTDEICTALFVSKSNLYRAFSSVMARSPMQYVRQKRLLLAHQRLQRGEKPQKVCAACGFSDYSTFYRAYRAYFGASPTEQCLRTAKM